MKKTISGFINKFKKLHKEVKKKKAKINSVSIENKPAKKSREKKPEHLVQITISAATVVKILFIIFLFSLSILMALLLKKILIISAIVFFFALALSPILTKIEKKHIPRPLAILLVFAVFITILSILFVNVLPILAEQLLGIALDLRLYIMNDSFNIPILSKFLGELHLDATQLQLLLSKNLTAISQNIQSIAGSTMGIITGVFQGMLNFLFTLVLLFFVLMERERIGNFWMQILPENDREYIQNKIENVQNKMTKWFRGQLIMMTLIGILMYLGMKIGQYTVGMKYAATIGIFAGCMEIFPYLGCLMSTTLGILIAINISWSAVFFVLIWMLSVQFIEGNFLVPMVMEKVVGLSSAVILLMISMCGTIGYALGGFPLAILGIIIAVPTSASISLFVEDFVQKKY